MMVGRSRAQWWRLAAALVLCSAGACVALRTARQHSPAASAQANPNAAPATALATAPATAPVAALLTITVKDLRNKKGDLILGVFTQSDGFPNVQSKSCYWEVKPADADEVTFTAHLPPGRYAAGVLHDENRNG